MFFKVSAGLILPVTITQSILISSTTVWLSSTSCCCQGSAAWVTGSLLLTTRELHDASRKVYLQSYSRNHTFDLKMFHRETMLVHSTVSYLFHFIQFRVNPSVLLTFVNRFKQTQLWCNKYKPQTRLETNGSFVCHILVSRQSIQTYMRLQML